MEFALIKNKETKNILENLQKLNFNELKIDDYELLIFVTIFDEKFNCSIRNELNEKYEHYFELIIWKMFEYKESISINLNNIQCIDSLELRKW